MNEIEVTGWRAAASAGDDRGNPHPSGNRGTAGRAWDAAIGTGRGGVLPPSRRPGASLYLGIDPGAGGAIASLDSEGRLIAVEDMPTVMVTPQAWKRSTGIASAKGAAREAAMRLWSAQAGLFARAKDDGSAEAALLARHGWLQVARARAA